MLDDKVLIEHSFTEKPHEFKIYPIGDVHLGSIGCKENEWADFCTRILKEENAYIFILGDMLDNTTRNSVGEVYANKYSPSYAKHQMIDMLKPIKDRILCYVDGNHERRSTKEVDSFIGYDICTCLDIEDVYRPNAAFVIIRFGKSNANGTRNPTYTFAVTHGASGGNMFGSSVNKANQWGSIIEGVDGVCVGHSHKPFDTVPARLCVDPRNRKISVKPFCVVSCSSWLDYGGYALRGMLSPAASCTQVIQLSTTQKQITLLNSIAY